MHLNYTMFRRHEKDKSFRINLYAGEYRRITWQVSSSFRHFRLGDIDFPDCRVELIRVCEMEGQGMSENKNGWGGAREGAGRRPAAADGTERRMRSLRASDGEWEVIKAFAKILKDNPERAARMMAIQ